MAVTDTYVELKSESKQVLFTTLFDLKKQKKEIEDRIKGLELQYKPMVELVAEDLFFVLPNGIKFSIKKSTRVGTVNTKKMIEDGINVDSYRGKPTEVTTIRLDK